VFSAFCLCFWQRIAEAPTTLGKIVISYVTVIFRARKSPKPRGKEAQSPLLLVYTDMALPTVTLLG